MYIRFPVYLKTLLLAERAKGMIVKACRDDKCKDFGVVSQSGAGAWLTVSSDKGFKTGSTTSRNRNEFLTNVWKKGAQNIHILEVWTHTNHAKNMPSTI